MANLIYTISDTHINNFTQFSSEVITSEHSGINSRCNNILDAIKVCAKQAVADDAEALVIPGDLFHVRGLIPVAVYTAAYKVFEEISKKIQLFIMPGNHDFCSSTALKGDEGLHSLYGFKAFANIATKPEMFVTDSFTISMVPYNPSKEMTLMAAQTLYKRAKRENKRFDLIFYHHSLSGAETGPNNFKMPEELTHENLPPFVLSVSGHLHKHQRIGKSFIYVGSPIMHDAGERNYHPGWLSIDNKGGFKHIENTVSPRFVVVEASSEKELKILAEQDYKIVKWTGDEDKGYKLRDSYDNIRMEIVPKEVKTIIRSNISSTDSAENMMRKYMDAKRGSIDEELLKYGLEIWRDNAV